VQPVVLAVVSVSEQLAAARQLASVVVEVLAELVHLPVVLAVQRPFQ
jgi:hypothetical protein